MRKIKGSSLMVGWAKADLGFDSHTCDYAARPGRSTHRGGDPQMLITDTAAVTALTDALSVPDGGFTVSLPDGYRPIDGYVLSIYPDREIKFHGTPRPADLVAYVNDHADILRQRGAYLGGWHDPATHDVYLDVSVWVPDRATADRLARAAGQLAYFDVTAGRSVALAPMIL